VSRGEDDRIEIRSYRNVFALERRIYRVEGVRLNPGGIPVRGVVYFLALLAGMLALGGLPVTGWLLAWLPWYARDLALPVGAAAMLALVRVEGRPCHLAGHALLRFAFSARKLRGLRPAGRPAPGRRWNPPELVMLVDGSEARLRRLRFSGPGAVLVTVPHRCLALGGLARKAGSRLRVQPLSSARATERPRVLELSPRARVDIERA
jgi:hypothetical protein